MNYTILHKILQNLRQSFFRTHCVTLTENMRSVKQCKLLNTVLLPRPPIEFVKHWNIIREPAGANGSRACNLVDAVDTTTDYRFGAARVAVGCDSRLRRAHPRPLLRVPANSMSFKKYTENTYSVNTIIFHSSLYMHFQHDMRIFLSKYCTVKLIQRRPG